MRHVVWSCSTFLPSIIKIFQKVFKLQSGQEVLRRRWRRRRRWHWRRRQRDPSQKQYAPPPPQFPFGRGDINKLLNTNKNSLVQIIWALTRENQSEDSDQTERMSKQIGVKGREFHWAHRPYSYLISPCRGSVIHIKIYFIQKWETRIFNFWPNAQDELVFQFTGFCF